MSIVSTDNIQEDMVLSDDIRDLRGRLLLKKGQTIKGDHVRVFKMWGVTEVNIHGDTDIQERTESSIAPEALRTTEKTLRHIFRHVDLSHPAIGELFRLSVLFRSQENPFKAEDNVAHADIGDSEDHIKPNVRKIIMEKEVKLPEIPSIVFELNEIMADPMASSHDIAQVVTKSPSLAAVLLRIVNSSFYGFPSEIDSITRAVTIIGTREIGSLALGISIITMFEGIPKDLIEMFSFLRHSFACGIISRILAAQKMLPQTEQLFVSGLLHDIGRLIIYKYFPDHAKALLRRSLMSGRLLYQEEENYLGCRHTEVARYLIKKWKLPFVLENNIFYHHNPSAAHDPERAAIVHVADLVANALGLGSSGERCVPPLDLKAWDILELSPSCFEVVTRQAINQLSAFETFFRRQERPNARRN
jgi:HD-like signal output (HDOD) protein